MSASLVMLGELVLPIGRGSVHGLEVKVLLTLI